MNNQNQTEYLREGSFLPNFKFLLGTDIGAFTSDVGYFSSYAGFEGSTTVTNRLNISAGMGMRSVFVDGNKGVVSLTSNAPVNFASFYLRGDYLINSNLTISTIGYKTVNLGTFRRNKNEELNPQTLDLTNQGVLINVNYKINSNFQINASFSYDKGYYHPYNYNNRLMNKGFYNPAFGVFGGY